MQLLSLYPAGVIDYGKTILLIIRFGFHSTGNVYRAPAVIKQLPVFPHYAMSSEITEAEQNLDALLPAKRLTTSPPAELINAAKAWADIVWDEAGQLGPMPLSDETLTSGHDLAAHPVFIFGVHRSGTTLVRNILDGHPDLVVLPSEGTYYTNLEAKLKTLPERERMAFLGKEWLRRLANPINQPPYWLLGRSTDISSPYVNFARYLMAWWALLKQNENTQWPHTAVVLAYASCTNNISAKFWVDKTPVNERYIKRIWREMPSAQIIHVVRDPVSILASRKKMEPGVSLRGVLRDMKMSFTVAAEYAADPRLMLVRYEELCDDPQKTIKQLASFLHIDEPGILNRATVAGLPAQTNSSFDNGDYPPGQILKARQRQQPDTLSNTEQQFLKAYISKAAAKLNYPVEHIGLLHKYYFILRYCFFVLIDNKH